MIKNGGKHLTGQLDNPGKKSMILIVLALLVGAGIMPGISGDADTLLFCDTSQDALAIGEMGTLLVTLESAPYSISYLPNGKAEIGMETFGSILSPGCPELPSRVFLIGVPPGAEVTSVELASEHHEEIPGNYDISNAPAFCSGISNNSGYESNEEAFSPMVFFPSDVFEYLGMGQLRKYSFARVRFSPVSYVAAVGELTLHREITLRVGYKIVKELPNELLSDAVMDDVASEVIENYELIYPSYVQPLNTPSIETYNYVIITAGSLEKSVTFLKNWKEYIGYSVKVVNTDWIYSSYAGADEQEKIRNFLIDNYASWGIEYVLIVGSHDEIPMRYCYKPLSSGRAIPTDYYYADLTGNWDSDGDGIFAEFNDDDWPDFAAEIWVGRIPFDSPRVVEDICQKTIDFERDSGSWKKKALLLGAISNFGNEDTQGQPKTDKAVLMEKLCVDIFDPAGFAVTTMYEKEGLTPSTYYCDYPLTRENVLAQWPNGYGVVNWGGHGNPAGSYRRWWSGDADGDYTPDKNEIRWDYFITSPDAIALNDDMPSIIFSCSCSNANPDDPENLGYALMENGAVAFVGATFESIYFEGWNNENDGGNMAIDYFFTEYLISSGQACAEALYNSKFHCWNDVEELRVFSNMFVFCLYGDPSVSLETFAATPPPDSPSTPSGAESGKPLTDYVYSTSATDPDGNQLYYIWDWGDGSDIELVGPYNSGETIEAHHEWQFPGDYNIRVKAKNLIGVESEYWSEPLMLHIEGPVIEVDRITGGLFKVNAVIKNTGDAKADNVEWGIRLNGGSILLGEYSSGEIETIPAGGEATIVSQLMFGWGLPAELIIEAGMPGSPTDIKLLSANIILFLIRIK